MLSRVRIHFLLLVVFLAAGQARGAMQFDVFLGYDQLVPQASWIPVVCEVKNDGPTFTGVIEIAPGPFSGGQPRRVIIELPTGTLKRVTIPLFATTQYAMTWDARLLNERGKVVAEQLDLRPRRLLSPQTSLIGSVARTPSGAPAFRPVASQQENMQPGSARLITQLVPDNPIVLEGLDAVYLNSEMAINLSESQARALVAWLFAGGNLIVGVEQISDVNANPWLRSVFPMELSGVRSVERHLELQAWLTQEMEGRSYPFTNLQEHLDFEIAPLQVGTGKLRDGKAVVSSEGTPLIVTAARGRGKITAILMSTEREPMRSWKNLPVFWTKLAEVPPKLFVSADYSHGAYSVDGVFGAMIDSKQVRKLPVHWLLLLLVVYLAVIGPVDHFWLKRINRPMLTWITFPAYVVVFSFLIYFIGYKLRSGETEWNELHVVDVFENGPQAELRGRTFASIYSPVNQKYVVESKQPFATFRGEFSGSWQTGQDKEKATVIQHGDNYIAEIFVPVWTSQLFVSDWWQPGSMPLRAEVKRSGNGWQAKVENRLDRKIKHAKLVIGERIHDLGELAAEETRTFTFGSNEGQPLQAYLSQHGGNFPSVVQSRQHTFGSATHGQIADAPNAAITASFIGKLETTKNFVAPPGLELTSSLERGQAVVFGWVSDFSFSAPINQFKARRSQRDTLLRLTVMPQEGS